MGYSLDMMWNQYNLVFDIKYVTPLSGPLVYKINKLIKCDIGRAHDKIYMLA